MCSISRERRRGGVVAETQFSLVYEGPALADNSIPVRDLAPSLFALSELFREANDIVYPFGMGVSLNVRADEAGSFWVHLTLQHLEGAVDLLASDAAQAIVNLKEMIIYPGVGLFWWIQRRGRRHVVRQEPVRDDPERITVTLDDQTSVTLPARTYQLSENIRIRRRAMEVVSPLQREGVEAVAFRPEEEVEVTVRSDDVQAFAVPDDAESREYLTDEIFEVYLTVETVAFTEDRPWRCNDGEHSFTAWVEDSEFIERVASSREAFRAGDRLRCRVRRRQYETETGQYRSEWSVLEVLEHLPAPQQSEFSLDAALPGSENDESASREVPRSE